MDIDKTGTKALIIFLRAHLYLLAIGRGHKRKEYEYLHELTGEDILLQAGRLTGKTYERGRNVQALKDLENLL